MAISDKATNFIDLLAAGVSPNDADKGVSWIQNMVKEQSSWKTRAGFGVLGEYDSGLTSGTRNTTIQNKGLKTHLGSKLITTSFGHTQIISIFRAILHTADIIGNRVDQKRTIFSVHIYDVTTDQHWEEVLIEHTSEDVSLEVWEQHGSYETSNDATEGYDRQLWIDAGQSENLDNKVFSDDDGEFFWFSEINNRLLFGSKRAGIWTYNPSDFSEDRMGRRQVRQSVNGQFHRDYRDTKSETAVITPVHARDGIFTEGFTYLTQDELGKPQACTVLGRRAVYAVDNLLYFSDPEEPGSIIAENVQNFSSDIIAIASTLGNLIVWLKDKTVLYNPASGEDASLISGGRTTVLSESVSCLGQNAWVNVDGAIVWADKTGFYRNHGNVTITKISEPLEIFFREGMSNPLNSYYTANATTNMASPQPTTYYTWDKESQVGVNLSYEPNKKQIMFNIPHYNFSIILEAGGYHFWSYETIVDNTPEVKATKNLHKPWLLAMANRVFMVSSWSEVINDGTPGSWNAYADSVLFLELGRGGSLDRSSVLSEDRRWMSGERTSTELSQGSPISGLSRDRGYISIEKPEAIPPGYNFSWASVTSSTSDICPLWLPIDLVPNYDGIETQTIPAGTYENVISIRFEFTFDNSNWVPYFSTNGINNYEIAFDLPSERLAAVNAYAFQAANAPTTDGIYCLDSGTGLGSTSGDTIVINVKSSLAAAADWNDHPLFSFSARNRNPLIRIPFKRISPAVNDTFDLGIVPTVSIMDTQDELAAGTTHNIGAIVWQSANIEAFPATLHDETSLKQAVDWVYQADQISNRTEEMMKLRGLSTKMYSHGTASTPEVGPNWPVGLFNVALSTNFKLYASQELDFAGTPESNSIIDFSKSTIRKRVGTSAEQRTPTFNNGNKWGQSGVPNAGNFLIADGAYNSIRTSGNVKGDSITSQIFGHIRDKAEGIKIGAVKAVVRMVGGFRRRGR